MFTIWPSTVWTSVAQPTEQKGQTLGVTLALAIRSASVCASTGWRSTPAAISPPSAVALLPASEKRRTSRREIAMAETPSRIPQVLACKRLRPHGMLGVEEAEAYLYTCGSEKTTSGFRRHFQVVDDLIDVHDTACLQPGDVSVSFAVHDAGECHGAVVDQDVDRIVADGVVAKKRCAH